MPLVMKLVLPLALVVSLSPVGIERADEPEFEFGMRLRRPPEQMKTVSAPAVVRESPENEAKVVRLPDGALAIYYIARPSGKELRSLTSTDGGLTWGQDRLEC